MMSAVLMLGWLGLGDAASRFDRALLRVYSDGRVRTGDLGGSATTREFTDAVIAAL
jgi:isocitrate dehydrogenase (NAD+)